MFGSICVSRLSSISGVHMSLSAWWPLTCRFDFPNDEEKIRKKSVRDWEYTKCHWLKKAEISDYGPF